MTDERRTSRRDLLRSAVASAVTLGAAGCSRLPIEEFTGGGGGDLRSISYGETREGFVNRGDGRDPAYDDLAEPVQFDGEAGDVVTITMVSTDVDAYIVLTDGNGNTIAEDDDSAGSRDSRVETTLPSDGTYTIWAGSFSGEATGAYTLTLSKVGEAAVSSDGGGGQDLRQISYGQTRQGYIDADDGREPAYSKLAEPVQFDGQEGDNVLVSMSSGDVDCYLVLADPDGAPVAENDDGGGGLDSRLETTLTTSGTYTIWAATYSGSATGSYTLTLQKTGESATGGDLRQIAYGQTRRGYIDADDGREPAYSKLAEPVQFDGREGDVVRISMDSDQVDCYLVLADPAGSPVAEDDDGGGGLDSRLETTLSSSGTYTIWAATYSGSATGSYTLTLQKTGESVSGGDLRQISYGQTRQGYIDADDGRDPAYGKLGEPVAFDGQAGDDVVVSMRSEAVDCYVVLADPSGAPVAENDDGGGGLDSRLATSLSATGQYTIWATSFGGEETGPYTLTLDRS